MRLIFTFLVLVMLPIVASAEIEVSLYVGPQSAPPSDVTVEGDSVLPAATFRQDWEGQSFQWPIYAGARLTYWQSTTFGFGVDYTHNKTRPNDIDLPGGYRALEFTDGLNTWTINAYQRWPAAFGDITPYIGGGVGISAPGVEVRYGTSDTFEYQITGPAAVWLAGVSYPIADDWSFFGEYKGTYTRNTVDLETGGTLKSDITTHAMNFGISYRF